MRIVLILLVCIVPMLHSAAQKSGELKVRIDLTKSSLEWTGKKLGGEHYGTLKLNSGSLFFTKNKLSGGVFEMDMSSIACTDISDEKSNRRLVDHLKSEDFFSVVKFPIARFEITKAEYKSENEYFITGNLSIKGKSNPISFMVNFKGADGERIAVAPIVFDRSKYDVKFGSQSFFENLGDKLVYDDIEINVKLSLMKL